MHPSALPHCRKLGTLGISAAGLPVWYSHGHFGHFDPFFSGLSIHRTLGGLLFFLLGKLWFGFDHTLVFCIFGRKIDVLAITWYDGGDFWGHLPLHTVKKRGLRLDVY